MRSVCLLTSKMITQEVCLNLLTGKVAGIKKNGVNDVCTSKGLNSAYFFLETGDQKEDEPLPSEWIEKVPYKNVHFVDIDYHFSAVMKRIVQALLPEFPDMYVVVEEIFDDGEEKVVPAEEYLKMEFDW